MAFDFVKFENYLKNRHLSAKTIATYKTQLNRLQESIPQIFDIESKDDLLSLVSLRNEYSNKSYLLDRVTIGSAINYFREVIPFINPSRWEGDTTTVDISIYYFDKKDYFIQSIALKDLAEWLSLFSHYLSKESPYNTLKEYSFDQAVFYVGVEKFKQIVGKNNIEDVALHIKYKDSQCIKYRAVIGQYLNYVGLQMGISASAINRDPMTKKIRSKNPKHWIPRYVITVPLTGCTPLQVAVNQLNESVYILEDCSLTLPDLGKIFNLTVPTVKKLVKDFKSCKGFYFSDTSVRRYYSVEATNNLLKKSHFHKKVCKSINYGEKGYKKWCNRKQCLEILGVGKTSFYKKRSKIKTYISYTQDKKNRLYYKPEIRYLKKHF